jgi:hypothetical protein
VGGVQEAAYLLELFKIRWAYLGYTWQRLSMLYGYRYQVWLRLCSPAWPYIGVAAR